MRLPALAFAVTAAFPALAAPTEDWSARMKSEGLAKTEAAIAALAQPTPDDLFALGGVRFLAGIEQALHLRWQVGATAELAPVPLLRLTLPDNPAPEPYRASLVTEVFSGARAKMDASAAALAQIPDAADIAVTIRLDDLWFDIDGSGSEGPGEALMPLALSALSQPWDQPEMPAGLAPSIRFDSADVAWLSAYTHLVSALAEFTLAFDPTAATEKIIAAAEDKRTRLGADPSFLDQMTGMGPDFDKLAIVYLMLRQPPDAERTRAAKTHLLSMVADNQKFWAKVATETDDNAEWIPNGKQTSAFGIVLPPETGQTWLGVLADLQGMLEGRLLVPHFALPPTSGIDLGKWFDEPAPLDLIGWLHGVDALPYARTGATIDGRSWNAFSMILGGESLLYALYLN